MDGCDTSRCCGGAEGGPEYVPGTPESEAEMARYAAFDEKAGEAVVGGVALEASEVGFTVHRTAGAPEITDGPFAEGAEVVGGFYALDVPDLDAALELAAALPAARGGFVEVWPTVEFRQDAGPMADWWLALLREPAADVVAPDDPAWESGMAEHVRFGEEHGAVLRGGAALCPPSSATTVRVVADRVILSDGPFAEGAEVVNGAYLFAAPAKTEAAALAAAIPVGPRGHVEVRRVVDFG